MISIVLRRIEVANSNSKLRMKKEAQAAMSTRKLPV